MPYNPIQTSNDDEAEAINLNGLILNSGVLTVISGGINNSSTVIYKGIFRFCVTPIKMSKDISSDHFSMF